MMKKILQNLLAFLASRVILARRPEIIGVTGSVGKTSTKEAITEVLTKHFQVRGTYKNYNNEIGLPLTVIGEKSPGKSLFGWLRVFKKGFSLITKHNQFNYPDFLVLEMGIDRPGDMDYLLKIVRPTRSVITKLGQAHLEFFKSLEHLHNEKIKLAQALPQTGWIIYNYDDENLRALVKALPRQSLGYGFTEGADVRAENFSTSQGKDDSEAGISFKMIYQGSAIPVFLPHGLGRPLIYSSLAAASVAFTYGLNGLEIANDLRLIKQPAGRLQLIKGQNNTLIIDDTYNSSPDSVFEGLKACLEVEPDLRQRVIVVLGDMRELGALSKKGHEDVGDAALKITDYIIAVGEDAKMIYEQVKNKTNQAKWFSEAREAADYLKNIIKPKDLLFIKGSQAVRLEKIVKKLMLEPDKASDLLTRQGEEWKDK